MPLDFISDDGFGITDKCREYLYPLIQGEAYPDYDERGMPRYVVLKNELIERKLAISSSGSVVEDRSSLHSCKLANGLSVNVDRLSAYFLPCSTVQIASVGYNRGPSNKLAHA